MRTHVTFQADFPKESSPAEPAGRELARNLASHLADVGFTVDSPEPHEGYAYTFACRRAKHSFVVFVGLVDDGIQEWLVFAERAVGVVTGWLRKVGVGRAKGPDQPLQDLCTAIHECLRKDERFRSIRWYTTEGWDNNPDGDWARAP